MSIKQINEQKDILYNNILLLSRNSVFYTKFNLNDTFQNRIHLIFIHIFKFIRFIFVIGINNNISSKVFIIISILDSSIFFVLKCIYICVY